MRALRGFERVHLPAGGTRHVHPDLSSRDLSMVSESGDRIIVPGDYGLTIGGGQPGPSAAPSTPPSASRDNKRYQNNLPTRSLKV